MNEHDPRIRGFLRQAQLLFAAGQLLIGFPRNYTIERIIERQMNVRQIIMKELSDRHVAAAATTAGMKGQQRSQTMGQHNVRGALAAAQALGTVEINGGQYQVGQPQYTNNVQQTGWQILRVPLIGQEQLTLDITGNLNTKEWGVRITGPNAVDQTTSKQGRVFNDYKLDDHLIEFITSTTAQFAQEKLDGLKDQIQPGKLSEDDTSPYPNMKSLFEMTLANLKDE